MAKITLDNIASGYASTTKINNNNDAIEAELNDKVLYRNNPSGEANQMENELDMNSNRIINLPDGVNNQEAVTVQQLNGAIAAAGSGLISAQTETQKGSAASGQVFTFTGITYTVGGNNLYVFHNGVKLSKGRDYTETSSSSITLDSAITINSGDDFDFITNLATTNSTTDTSAITHTQSGNSYNLATYLQNRHVVNVKDYGAVMDGVTDDSSAIQAAANAVKAVNGTLVFPDGPVLIGTTIDLSAPGGGDEGHRNLEVICGHETKFSGTSNAVTLFNIQGQRRFKWSGGWFRKGNVCFQGVTSTSPQSSDAYAYFNNVIFDGESAGAIQKCYYSIAPIGVYFTDCNFGTDGANDQIDLAVDMPANTALQSNLAKFTRCCFINNVNSVNMGDSSFVRYGTSFTDCRFESLSGYAINAGTNTRDLRLTNCYFEACGSASVKPIILTGAQMVMDGGQIVGNQNNADAFIAVSSSSELETRGMIDYIASSGTAVFAEFASGITQPQYLRGLHIIGTGSETYKSLLFSTASQADEQYINWEMPRYSSTLTDTQLSNKFLANLSYKGVTSYVSEDINLTAVSTNYTVCSVNVPTGSHGLRVEVETYQTIQGVGHAGQYNQWLVYYNSGWTKTAGVSDQTVAGFVFDISSTDANNFDIVVQRTSGGATNTPVKVKVTIHQAAYQMDGAEIMIS